MTGKWKYANLQPSVQNKMNNSKGLSIEWTWQIAQSKCVVRLAINLRIFQGTARFEYFNFQHVKNKRKHQSQQHQQSAAYLLLIRRWNVYPFATEKVANHFFRSRCHLPAELSSACSRRRATRQHIRLISPKCFEKTRNSVPSLGMVSVHLDETLCSWGGFHQKQQPLSRCWGL